MIELKIKKTLIRLDFSFFAVLTVFLLFDKTDYGLSALAACGLHELSHLIVMTALGIPAEKITFYGAGIRITSTEIKRAKTSVRAAVLSAGCAANFLGAALLLLFNLHEAAAINLVTGLFNLLPIGELDGAGLLRMCAISICEPEKVDRVLRTAAVVCTLLCAALVIAFGNEVPFTFLITIIYFAAMGSCNI